MTVSMKSSDWGTRVSRILAAAINAVEPGEAVTQAVRIFPENETPDHKIRLTIGGRSYPPGETGRVFVVGAGKAGAPMAQAICQLLGDRITKGAVIVKEGYAGDSEGFGPVSLIEAGHPLPDERGVKGAGKIIELMQETRADDLVICLISGGGSALLVSPAEGLSLADLQETTSILLASGANINEFNTVRKHLEQLKGGNLARLAAPAQVIALVLSDVVGDPLEVIGSGPTVPDPTTYADTYGILKRYGSLTRVPPVVVAHLERGLRGEIPETPKPGDPIFSKVNNWIIGSNAQAAQAALDQARLEGFHSLLLTTFLQGEARQVGRVLGAIARQLALGDHPIPRPACLVLGGETTVTLQSSGLGGRNQEMALAATQDLAGLPGIALITLASDGGDGPSDAAGAVVTGETAVRAHMLGLEPEDFLARNDAYHFFEPLGDLLKPGPTRTNVNDLAFLFAF